MMRQSSLSPVEQSVAGKACPAAISLASVATDCGPENRAVFAYEVVRR